MRYANHSISSLGCGLDHRKASLLAFGDDSEQSLANEKMLADLITGLDKSLIEGTVNDTR
jgi:hypothetical protein